MYIYIITGIFVAIFAFLNRYKNGDNGLLISFFLFLYLVHLDIILVMITNPI